MNIMCIVCGMISGELLIGKNLEGSACGLIKVLPHRFSRGTEENMNAPFKFLSPTNAPFIKI
jgi:hypothetical protein